MLFGIAPRIGLVAWLGIALLVSLVRVSPDDMPEGDAPAIRVAVVHGGGSASPVAVTAEWDDGFEDEDPDDTSDAADTTAPVACRPVAGSAIATRGPARASAVLRLIDATRARGPPAVFPPA